MIHRRNTTKEPNATTSIEMNKDVFTQIAKPTLLQLMVVVVKILVLAHREIPASQKRLSKLSENS